MHLTSQFDQALHYAVLIHAGQIRKGTDIPYLAHLLTQSRHRVNLSQFSLMTDAVEKGLSMSPARNYRIAWANI